MNQPDKNQEDLLVHIKKIPQLLTLFACLTVLLALLLIRIDAFETFFHYSRQHENWDLDEIMLTILAMLIAGAFSAVFLSFTMMRQIRELARQKIATEHKLMESRKIQAMGNMLGGVAHSMNNHLQPIIILSRLIKSELPEDSENARDLEKINRAARNASDMLRSVLNFAHSREKESGSCKITPTLESAVGLAKISTPSSITVEEAIESLPGSISMKNINLEIIIFNLFKNAIDAIAEKQGIIRISLEQCQKPSREHKQKQWVCITITDTGSGMTGEQQKHIYDPFYTSKPVGKGTGLGLSETYGLVSAAGGVIDVSSAPGKGCSFMVYLPIIEKGA